MKPDPYNWKRFYVYVEFLERFHCQCKADVIEQPFKSSLTQ